MSTDYLDQSHSWELDAVLALQERAAREYDLNALWRDQGYERLLAQDQNEAMGVYAHARIAYARYIGQVPDPFDVELTGVCMQRAAERNI